MFRFNSLSHHFPLFSGQQLGRNILSFAQSHLSCPSQRHTRHVSPAARSPASACLSCVSLVRCVLVVSLSSLPRRRLRPSGGGEIWPSASRDRSATTEAPQGAAGCAEGGVNPPGADLLVSSPRWQSRALPPLRVSRVRSPLGDASPSARRAHRRTDHEQSTSGNNVAAHTSRSHGHTVVRANRAPPSPSARRPPHPQSSSWLPPPLLPCPPSPRRLVRPSSRRPASSLLRVPWRWCPTRRRRLSRPSCRTRARVAC